MCFDANYNIQAEVAIESLIINTTGLFEIHIIHNSPESFDSAMRRIKKNKTINSINMYKFSRRPGIVFQNFEESHMTEATYYRLFIEDYLPKNINNILYIDPDVVCINNIDKYYDSIFDELSKTEFVISAKTETYEDLDTDTSKRLGITRGKYFNAGVTFINLNKWVEKNYTENLILRLSKLGVKGVTYDQDVMNSFIDGCYLELPKKLNFTNESLPLNTILEEVVIYHFLGKKKPWTVKGLYDLGSLSNIYQKIHRKLHNKNYHIKHVYKPDSVKNFIKLLFTLRILVLKSPGKYFFNFVTSLKKSKR